MFTLVDGASRLRMPRRGSKDRLACAVLPLAAPVQAVFGGEAIPMLTDFGLVTVVDLTVALLGVMLVLPAALVWAEGGFQPVAEPAARLGRRLGGLIPARLRPGSR